MQFNERRRASWPFTAFEHLHIHCFSGQVLANAWIFTFFTWDKYPTILRKWTFGINNWKGMMPSIHTEELRGSPGSYWCLPRELVRCRTLFRGASPPGFFFWMLEVGWSWQWGFDLHKDGDISNCWNWCILSVVQSRGRFWNMEIVGPTVVLPKCLDW